MSDILNGSRWRMEQADCIEHLATMPDCCIDFSVFSPPFPSMFAYSESSADIGNSEDFAGEAKCHMGFFYSQLGRVVKPGRAIVVHVMQIPRLKRSGQVGLHDFRGLNIRLGERSGLIYEYDWCVTKNPQSQAIRTHSHELQFSGLEKDQAMARGALPDYLIKFRVPGDNQVPVVGQVTRNEWIQLAEGCWTWHDIKATETLNTREAKGDSDTKHIAPLQLEVIRRLVKLYTNPDEIVLSPFAGVGSEGYEAVKLGRRFYGIEMKEEYFLCARKNLQVAERVEAEHLSLF